MKKLTPLFSSNKIKKIEIIFGPESHIILCREFKYEFKFYIE